MHSYIFELEIKNIFVLKYTSVAYITRYYRIVYARKLINFRQDVSCQILWQIYY